MHAPRAAGRYAIFGPIASGGMASVHVGRFQGPGGFSRVVAIKQLHPQFAGDPDFYAMFLDEARVASRIRHPNVVPILDVVAEAGELFLVMEYVQGEALSKLLHAARADIPLPIAIAIVVGMLEGLHAAHEARGENGEELAIVHRDVSPQNVLVGIDGVARVIDFGVAKAIGNSRVTRQGQIKGKVAYMAPEQIRARPLDARADVYASAVVLWETLTRKRLLGDADNDAASVLRALEGRFDPPSAHRPDIPAELDRIVARGLAPKAEDRFATAREMAQELERVATPAPAREVGLWVAACSGAAIDAREARVRSLEAESAVTALPLAAEAAPEPAAPADPVTTAIRPTPRRRSWTTAAISAGLVVAAAIGFMASRAFQSAPPPAPSASEPVGAVTAEPTAAPESPSSKPEPSIDPPVIASAAPMRTGPRARPPAGGGHPKADCKPPYTITADGVRQYKPECVK